MIAGDRIDFVQFRSEASISEIVFMRSIQLFLVIIMLQSPEAEFAMPFTVCFSITFDVGLGMF